MGHAATVFLSNLLYVAALLTAIYILSNCIVQRFTRVWLYFDSIFHLTRVAQVQKSALKDLHMFTKQIVHERREFRKSNAIEDYVEDDNVYGKKSRVALLDLLLDQEQKGYIDDDGLREEADTFMFEGHDTTSMALSFMLMRFANEPEVQNKIHAELSLIFGDSNRVSTIEDLTQMKYLECCIKESLRLYPSVPYIARFIVDDVTLIGYKVPGGTICNIHIFDVHRRADIYPNPERFLPENVAKRHSYAYVPFSAGPRNCIVLLRTLLVKLGALVAMLLHAMLLFCAAALLAVLLASLYYRVNYSGRLLHKIPGPKGVPVIGNILDILLHPETLFMFVRKMHRDHGDIAMIKSFFYRAVNLYSPADIEVILSSAKYNEKKLPYTFLYPWLGQGLLVNNGEKWHHRRKLLTPAFHFNILKKFTRTFNDQTAELIESVQEETEKDSTEIMPLIMKQTLRIMCETSMGTSMHEDIRSVSSKYFTALYVLGQCLVQRITRVWLYFDLIFNLTRVAQVHNAAVKDLHMFTKQIIQERKEYRQNTFIDDLIEEDEVYGKKSRVAMLDLLLDHEQQGRIDDDGIREEVDTFMFEGHDTTAMALCFMIMRIANEPVIQEKIHEELSRIFGDSNREPTIEDLSELKYLECCIKESLRLYPSVPYIARFILEDTVLSGYKVPGGTICNIHIFDVHRRADIYPDPERFVPERFLPENVAKRHPYAYVPFSAGPRNCIGQKFALLEIKTLMSGLLRRYRLEPVTRPEDCQFICDIVLRVRNPIYVRFRNKIKEV